MEGTFAPFSPLRPGAIAPPPRPAPRPTPQPSSEVQALGMERTFAPSSPLRPRPAPRPTPRSSSVYSSPTPSPPSSSSASCSSTTAQPHTPLKIRIRRFSPHLREVRRRKTSRSHFSSFQRRDALIRPAVFNAYRMRRESPQFELLSQTTFGAEGKRANKSLSLGTVRLTEKSQLHHLVALRNFNPQTYTSSQGIKLFVEQYVKLMQSNNFLLQCFDCVVGKASLR